MTSWFRSWHGAPTDTKWRTVAKRAGVPFGYVTAIVWVLLDRASQADQRGSIAGYDSEEIADTLGFDVEEIDAVIRALHEKEVLQDNAFSGWSTHQPAREDNSADRVRRHRQKQQGNTSKRDVTQCNAPDTEAETEYTLPIGKDAPASPPTAKERLWTEGKPMLVALGVPAKQSGSIIGRWLKDARDDARAVLSAITRARDQCPHDPIPWITATLKQDAGNGKQDTASQFRAAFDLVDQRIDAMG